MQTNTNPLPEIGVVLIALGFIAAGTALLALGKIDLNVAMTLYVLAASVAGINVAFKAPSPTQQAALVQLASQALSQQQAQPAQLVQAPAPVVTPQVVQQPFSNTVTAQTAGMTSMPSAMLTTQNMPAVKPPQ